MAHTSHLRWNRLKLEMQEMVDTIALLTLYAFWFVALPFSEVDPEHCTTWPTWPDCRWPERTGTPNSKQWWKGRRSIPSFPWPSTANPWPAMTVLGYLWSQLLGHSSIHSNSLLGYKNIPTPHWDTRVIPVLPDTWMGWSARWKCGLRFEKFMAFSTAHLNLISFSHAAILVSWAKAGNTFPATSLRNQLKILLWVYYTYREPSAQVFPVSGAVYNRCLQWEIVVPWPCFLLVWLIRRKSIGCYCASPGAIWFGHHNYS